MTSWLFDFSTKHVMTLHRLQIDLAPSGPEAFRRLPRWSFHLSHKCEQKQRSIQVALDYQLHLCLTPQCRPLVKPEGRSKRPKVDYKSWELNPLRQVHGSRKSRKKWEKVSISTGHKGPLWPTYPIWQIALFFTIFTPLPKGELYVPIPSGMNMAMWPVLPGLEGDLLTLPHWNQEWPFDFPWPTKWSQE